MTNEPCCNLSSGLTTRAGTPLPHTYARPQMSLHSLISFITATKRCNLPTIPFTCLKEVSHGNYVRHWWGKPQRRVIGTQETERNLKLKGTSRPKGARTPYLPEATPDGARPLPEYSPIGGTAPDQEGVRCLRMGATNLPEQTRNW